MQTKRKIEQYCKDNNITIVSLEYKKNELLVTDIDMDEFSWETTILINNDSIDLWAYTDIELIEEIKRELEYYK